VKIFTFIFCLYILLLSTVPCCAIDNCKDKTPQTQKAGTDKHNDDCKNCSPFNQCGNCTGFSFSLNIVQLQINQQLTQQAFPVYTQSYFNHYISSFWQPPRLGWQQLFITHNLLSA